MNKFFKVISYCNQPIPYCIGSFIISARLAARVAHVHTLAFSTHVLSSLAPLCKSGAHVVLRSLISGLEALNTFLQTHSVQLSDKEGDIVEFLEVLSRRRHQETTFEALVQQL